ncbi:MAG: transglycosylase SLT domain-containing protein [Candidatus Woesearchaeota archaeon]
MRKSERFTRERPRWSDDWTAVPQGYRSVALVRRAEEKSGPFKLLALTTAAIGILVTSGIYKVSSVLPQMQALYYSSGIPAPSAPSVREPPIVSSSIVTDNYSKSITVQPKGTPKIELPAMSYIQPEVPAEFKKTMPSLPSPKPAAEPQSKNYSQPQTKTDVKPFEQTNQKAASKSTHANLDKIVKDNWSLQDNLDIVGINKMIKEECVRYNTNIDKNFKGYLVDPNLFSILVKFESGYDPAKIHYKVRRQLNPAWDVHMKQVKKGKVQLDPSIKQYKHVYVHDNEGKRIPSAYGLAGLAPETAKTLGIKLKDILDSRTNMRGGIQKIGELLSLYDGDVSLALAGYNAGESRVEQFGFEIPPIEQTKNYVARITHAYAKLSSAKASKHR